MAKESIIFAQPLEKPVEAWFMPHPSVRLECTVSGFIGTPDGSWASISIQGEKTLVPIHQVIVDEPDEETE